MAKQSKWVMTHNQTEVGFEVQKVEPAHKTGCAVVYVKYPTMDTIYTYVRKYTKSVDEIRVVIDGCEVVCNLDWTVKSVERKYDTNGITNGTTATTYGSAKPCSAQNYTVFLLRALGYKDGTDFQYADALAFAQEKGFYSPELFSGTFLRDDLAALTYQGLAADMADGETYLLDSLVKSGAVDAGAAKTITDKIEAYRAMNDAALDTDAKSGSKVSDNIKAEMEKHGIEAPSIPEVPAGDLHHEKYDTIKACLECNIPVYLAGPAGSGKNHTVEQIAEELGWDFYFSNSVQQEYKLTGFIDAGGNFYETEFYKACTSDNDCIFFLDEMDASIPDVLVLLNAAIANGYFEFPNGRVNLKHVHFVAAGNTVGNGADEEYTGRMVLDQATLDRFAIIEFDYDIRIEMAISKNNGELVQFVRQLRSDAKAKGIRATFSLRCITMVTKLEKSGAMDLTNILKIAVVKGLDKDTINTLNASGDNKYAKALRDIQRAA